MRLEPLEERDRLSTVARLVDLKWRSSNIAALFNPLDNEGIVIQPAFFAVFVFDSFSPRPGLCSTGPRSASDKAFQRFDLSARKGILTTR